MSGFHEFANSFQAVTRPGLERISALLSLCGNPEQKLNIIHVAGTNGKGSVCAFLQCALSHAGFKTGKYISPNLVHVNERITIDGAEITDDALSDLLSRIEPMCKSLPDKPTQFEIWTAAALLYFHEQNCDRVILEVGLGGRFDATNVIQAPLCSVIAQIDIDHMEYLGDTIEKIAFEKAGIIKENSATIILQQDPKVLSVISEIAQSRNNKLIITETPDLLSPEEIHERVFYKNLDLTIGIPGEFQVLNATLAVDTLKFLGISDASIQYGIRNAKNPGRFEVINQSPLTIIDGAHNLNAFKALKSSLDRYFPDRKKTFILAFMREKEVEKILKELSENEFYFTTVQGNPRALSPEELFEIAKGLGIKGTPFETLQSAYAAARETGDLIIICGSLYLYSEAKELKL